MLIYSQGIMTSNDIKQRFQILSNPKKAIHLSQFFKTGKGEYGYGDKFLGRTVPETRKIVKECKDSVNIETCIELIRSEWHEIRLCGFLLLIELYKKAKRQRNKAITETIVETYIRNLDFGNNWDLVDLTSPYILGDWLIEHPEKRDLLDYLSDKDKSLWHQRVAIVSTLSLIKAGEFSDTIRIARKYLDHNHDLIHKATGWMLREMGKLGGYDELTVFLDQHSSEMPRTMLRYSIERFPENLRKYYLIRDKKNARASLQS